VQAGIVFDFVFATVFFYDAAVAVRGVLAEADVGNDQQLFSCGRLLERAQPALDDAVLIPCSCGLLVFGRGKAEEQEASDAEFGARLRLRR
jgi:hypothetical protein